MSLSLHDKLYHSSIAGAVFLVASLPQLYTRTNKLVSGVAGSPCPDYKSRLIHTLLFFVCIALVMKFVDKVKNNKLITKYSIYGALLFFFLSSPEMYSVTNRLVGAHLQYDPACPSVSAVILHTVVYVACLVGFMSLSQQ